MNKIIAIDKTLDRYEFIKQGIHEKKMNISI